MVSELIDPGLVPKYGEDWQSYCTNSEPVIGRRNAARLLARYLERVCQVIPIDDKIALSGSEEDQQLAEYIYGVLKILNKRLMKAFLEIQKWNQDDSWEAVWESLGKQFEEQSNLMKALGYARSYNDLYAEPKNTSHHQMWVQDSSEFNRIFFVLVNSLACLQDELTSLTAVIDRVAG